MSASKLLPSLLVGWALMTSTPARADTAETPEATRAQVLFDEALALMKRGGFEAACPKLAESNRLDPAGGTLLDLAYCYERTGQVDLAVRVYGQASLRAKADGRADRVRRAEEKLAELSPSVARVVDVPDVVVPKQPPMPLATPSASGRRGAAVATGVGGLVLAGAGTAAGVVALSKHKQSDALCPQGSCSPAGMEAERAADTWAWGCNIGVAVGAAALVAATYLWFSAPQASRVSATGSGLTVTF